MLRLDSGSLGSTVACLRHCEWNTSKSCVSQSTHQTDAHSIVLYQRTDNIELNDMLRYETEESSGALQGDVKKFWPIVGMLLRWEWERSTVGLLCNIHKAGVVTDVLTNMMEHIWYKDISRNPAVITFPHLHDKTWFLLSYCSQKTTHSSPQLLISSMSLPTINKPLIGLLLLNFFLIFLLLSCCVRFHIVETIM